MRLISLRLHQWRCYEDCSIEFPDGLTGVRGPNGAGKSTVVEAIGWALFGKRRARAKVADLRRQGAPKGAKSFVDLEFQLAGSTYRIERFVGGDARFWINGELETQKATDTNARVAQELDLTWDVFQRTVFAQQKDVAALDPSASADQRKSHVERLLGLERFKNAATRARSDAKLLTAELVGLRERAPDVSEVAEALTLAETAAAKDDPAVAAAQKAWKRATKARSDARTLLATEQERGKAHGLLAQRQETLTQTLSDTSQATSHLKAQLGERSKQIKRLEKLTQDIGRLSPVRKTLDLWEKLATAQQELQAVEAQLEDLQYDHKHATSEEKRLAALTDERTDLLADRPDLAAAVAAATVRLRALRAHEKAGAASDAAAAVRRFEQERKELDEEIAIVQAELAHDSEHVVEIEAGGPQTPCPTCKKPFGDEYTSILDGYRTRIATNRKRLPAIEASRERLQKRLETAREKDRAATSAEELLAETTGAADSAAAADDLELHEQALRNSDARFAELKKEIPALAEECKARTKHSERWRELEASRKAAASRKAKATKALSVPDYDTAAHEGVSAEHAKLVDLERDALALRDETADSPHLKVELEKGKKRLSDTQEALRSVEEELKKLAFDEDRAASLAGVAEKADEARDRAQETLAEAQLDAQSRSQEVQSLRKSLEEAEQTQNAIASKVDQVRQHEVAANLLAQYRDQQARRAWPRLEQVASALLNSATDGRYADLRLSADYRLIVVDRGEEHELARFSGGEQDLANLCLRLAIADWVSRERNVDLGFVVLDEVFGSQDEERRQRLLTELHGLSNRFRQVLLITHLPELAELCDAQIDVSMPEIGSSTATLV